MPGGYMGKLLYVDLSRGKIWTEETPEGYARAFLGGSGLACRMLIDMIGPDTDPLGPDNVLMFMAGPLTGTEAPCCGRYTICSKSPQTGIWGESNAGGYFGPRMKSSGFDGLVIMGRSEEPVYLYVHDGQAELRPAGDLWGLTTFETQGALVHELGSDVSVACIGPAGEKMVRFACVLNDGGRAAGRTGMGAVMGSKRLKAVAVSGDEEVPVANPGGLEEAVRRAREAIEESMLTSIFREFGTAGYVDYAQELGDMPNKYFSKGLFEEADKISGMTMAETILVGRRACFGCPIGCGRIVEVREGKYATPRTDGPGYEALAAFGSNLLVDDLEAITHINYLCNALGLDVISTGVVIGLAYKLFEEGVIGPSDTEGLKLEWGNPEPAVELVKAIASREGLGAVMAEGVRHMGRVFGREGEAAHVKGLEVPFHDPRAFFGMAVCYATSPRGACHLQGDMYMIDMGVEFPELGITSGDRFDLAGRMSVVAKIQDLRAVYNALVMCQFANLDGPILRDLLASVTGWDIRPGELALAGERIFNLKRIFNLRMGMGPAEDRLPELLLRPLLDGGAAGKAPDLRALLAEYYRVRNWDPETGWPRPEKLAELGLEELARG